MRKFLVMLLCLTLVCTFMPAMAWADGTESTEFECPSIGFYKSTELTEEAYLGCEVTYEESFGESEDIYLIAEELCGNSEAAVYVTNPEYVTEEAKLESGDFEPAGTLQNGFTYYIFKVTITEAMAGNTYTVSFRDQEDCCECSTSFSVLVPGENPDGDDEGNEDTGLQILDAIDGNDIGGTSVDINMSLAPADNAFFVRSNEAPECTVEVYTHCSTDDGWEPAAEPKAYITIEKAEEDGYWKAYVGRADNTYHGLESLRIKFAAGEEVAQLETNMGVGIIYSTAAVEKITDYRTILDEVLQDESITLRTEMQQIEMTADELKTAVLYEDFGMTTESGVIDNHVSLNIKLQPGYSVKDIKVNGQSAEYEATANYYYAPYDVNGNRIDASEDGAFSGCISGYGNSALWINSNLRNAEDPLEQLKSEMDQYEGGRAELLASAIQYSIEIADTKAVNAVEIVTAKAAVTDSITATDKEGENFEVNTSEENSADKTEDRNTALANLYSESKEVFKAYEITAEGDLNGIVDVVIPVENASNYQMVWFYDDNTPVPVVATYTEDNDAVLFPAGHFSLYALVKDADTSSDDEPGEGTGDGNDSGNGSYEPPYRPAPVVPSVPDDEAEKEAAEKAALMEAVKTSKLNAKSKIVTMASGKKAVKITWEYDGEVELDGVEIFRSTKRFSGFGKKPIFVAERNCYYNTAIEAGTKYYYKVRGFVMVDGEKVYTDKGTKAWRTVR